MITPGMLKNYVTDRISIARGKGVLTVFPQAQPGLTYPAKISQVPQREIGQLPKTDAVIRHDFQRYLSPSDYTGQAVQRYAHAPPAGAVRREGTVGVIAALSQNKYEVVLEQGQHDAALVTSRNDPQTNRKRSL